MNKDNNTISSCFSKINDTQQVLFPYIHQQDHSAIKKKQISEELETVYYHDLTATHRGEHLKDFFTFYVKIRCLVFIEF